MSPTETAVPSPAEFQLLPVLELIPSKTNPRKHFDPRRLAELAESVKTHGVLQPLVVRPFNGHYEIVSGERRWRAATQAAVDVVPVRIVSLSDEEALEIQLIENLQRDDLEPLEEGRGYRMLMQTNPAKHTVESIAARIGMSPKYVWDRMKLNDLVPEATALLETQRMSAGHAILIARLKPEQQARVLEKGLFVSERTGSLWSEHQGGGKKPAKDDGLKAVSLRELQAWIGDHIRFDVLQAAQAAPLEFEETAARVAAAVGTPGRGKKVVAITHEHFVNPDARSEERTFSGVSWKRADGKEKSKPCDHAVLGVIAVGPGYGEAFDVCVNKDCDVHWGVEKRARAKRKKAGATGGVAARAKRAAAEEARRKTEQQRADAARSAWKAATPAILEACAAKLKTVSVGVLADRLLGQADAGARKRALALLKPGKTADGVLRVAVLIDLISMCERWNAERAFPKTAKRLGVDVAKVLKTVQASAVADAQGDA